MRPVGTKISSRCYHTLTPDDEGQRALMFGGWGSGGLQQRETNKRTGAVTLAACRMRPHESIEMDIPLLRGRGDPEHK